MAYQLSQLDVGILRLTLIGDVTEEDWRAYLRESAPHLERAVGLGKPLGLLVNAAQVEKVSSSVRRGMVRVDAPPEEILVAVVGDSPYVRVLASFINRARGSDGYVHLFDSETEALAWLRQGA